MANELNWLRLQKLCGVKRSCDLDGLVLVGDLYLAETLWNWRINEGAEWWVNLWRLHLSIGRWEKRNFFWIYSRLPLTLDDERIEFGPQVEREAFTLFFVRLT